MILFANEISLPWMLVAGGGVLGLWLIMRRSFKRTLEPHENVFVKKEGLATLVSGDGKLDIPDELARWEVSMHQTARDLKAELDTKLIALQAITRHAQFEADRLEAAIVRAERLGLIATRDSLAALEGSSNPNELAKLAAGVTDTMSASSKYPRQVCDRIYAQADLGRTPATIAANIGVPVGDVELMLSWRD